TMQFCSSSGIIRTDYPLALGAQRLNSLPLLRIIRHYCQDTATIGLFQQPQFTQGCDIHGESGSRPGPTKHLTDVVIATTTRDGIAISGRKGRKDQPGQIMVAAQLTQIEV